MLPNIDSYRLQLHDFGPFTIPEKRHWAIVGSGPSADSISQFVSEYTDVGIISLNAELPGIPFSTVHIVGHYEYYLQCVRYLHKPDVLFFADPMSVGFRCVDVKAINLLDFEYFERNYPGKLRFFEKEADRPRLMLRNHTLYCVDTLASTAVHLLARNGITKSYFCGIDGHELSEKNGRSKMFENAYRVREPNGRVVPSQRKRYDDERLSFLDTGQYFGVELSDLTEVLRN